MSKQELRDEIQSRCFYWKSTHRHGHCKVANGMDHVCSFCELTEKFDAFMPLLARKLEEVKRQEALWWAKSINRQPITQEEADAHLRDLGVEI